MHTVLSQLFTDTFTVVKYLGSPGVCFQLTLSKAMLCLLASALTLQTSVTQSWRRGRDRGRPQDPQEAEHRNPEKPSLNDLRKSRIRPSPGDKVVSVQMSNWGRGKAISPE